MTLDGIMFHKWSLDSASITKYLIKIIWTDKIISALQMQWVECDCGLRDVRVCQRLATGHWSILKFRILDETF